MRGSIWRGWILLGLLAICCSGCDEQKFAEEFFNPDNWPDVEVSAEDDAYDESWAGNDERDSRRSESRDSASSRRDRWDDDRSDSSMPSRTERWGSDRRMPSDSTPSDSMPSRTERWGGERQMPSDSKPSDSMPSRTERWGGDRKMPSDSMPSDSFRRRPLPSESR